MFNKRSTILSLLVFTLLAASCTPKVSTAPFTAPAKANDDIATGIKIMATAEADLEKQKIISPQEALVVVKGLLALHGANAQFNSDLAIAKASGNKSALKPSLDALRKAVTDLNANGVLGIKSVEARQTFSLTMSTINLALATLETFVGN
jgi:hypothetical protein